MEGRYSPGVYIALTDCKEPSREGEFNRWYNEIVIPGLETLGYVRNSRRYENVYAAEATFRGRPKYLAVHEIYHDDLPKALSQIHKREGELAAQSAVSQYTLTKVNTLYRRAGPEFRSGKTEPIQIVYCGLVGYMDPTRKAEFDKWYNERHCADALEAGLFDVGYRYDVVDPHDPLPHLSSPCLSLYETSVNLPDLQKRLESFRRKMIEVDPVWVDLLGIWYSGLFRPM
jgi:hypothetical protein